MVSRPDPDFANVVLATSDARGRQHTMNASANFNLGPLPPAGGPGRRAGPAAPIDATAEVAR